MKVLFAGLRWEYGKKEWGPAFEYQNFYQVLARMPGVESSLFAIDEEVQEFGRAEANARLLTRVQAEKPDLLFCFLFTDQLLPRTIQKITQTTKTKTFNWFADDHWRFPIYSKLWAPHFTLVSTTDQASLPRYKAAGITGVILTQWAANQYVYTPSPGKIFDITFVGKNYGSRGQAVATLQRLDLPAQGFGGGWPGGRISHQQMLEVFTGSRVNLNFAESFGWSSREWFRLFAKLFIEKDSHGYHFCGHHLPANLQSVWGRRSRQIKGRVFEVPACGGFLLTGNAPGLDCYFKPGVEIETFKTFGELVEKCRYYLHAEPARKSIAQKGYERVLREHTYEHRFKKIFKALELE